MFEVQAGDTVKAFLKKVKKQRVLMRIPQKQLAHELNLTQGAYSKIEKGAKAMTFLTGIYLCMRLNLQHENFFIPVGNNSEMEKNENA